jgi:hypothetical protein
MHAHLGHQLAPVLVHHVAQRIADRDELALGFLARHARSEPQCEVRAIDMRHHPRAADHPRDPLGETLERAVGQRRIERAEPVEIIERDQPQRPRAFALHPRQQRLAGRQAGERVALLQPVLGASHPVLESIDCVMQRLPRGDLRLHPRQTAQPLGDAGGAPAHQQRGAQRHRSQDPERGRKIEDRAQRDRGARQQHSADAPKSARTAIGQISAAHETLGNAATHTKGLKTASSPRQRQRRAGVASSAANHSKAACPCRSPAARGRFR